jgi:cytochrome c biogenesis protein CcdA
LHMESTRQSSISPCILPQLPLLIFVLLARRHQLIEIVLLDFLLHLQNLRTTHGHPRRHPFKRTLTVVV